MADDGGEVQVRLSQEGGDEVIAKLQEIVERLADLAEAADKGNAETKELEGTLKEIEESSITTAISTATTAIMGFAGAVMHAAEEVKAYGEQLVGLVEQHEMMEIKLASLNEKTQGWAGAMAGATDRLDKLQQMSSGQNLEKLTSVFQRLTLLIGGTDTQIMDLTQRMEMFADKSGVTAEQLLRVIQMAERTGQLPMRGMMALASQNLQEAGISGTDIKAAAAEGGDALEKLTEKIKVSDAAAATLNDTWKYTLANFDRAKTMIEELIGDAFEPFKKVIQDITATFNDPSFRSQLDGWIASFKEIAAEIADVLWPALKKLGEALMNAFSDPAFVGGVKAVIDLLAMVVGAIASVIDTLGVMAVPLAAGAAAWWALSAAMDTGPLVAATAALGEMTTTIGGIEMALAPVLLAYAALAVAVGAIVAAIIYLTQLKPAQDAVADSNVRLTQTSEQLYNQMQKFGPQTKEATEAYQKLQKAKEDLAEANKGTDSGTDAGFLIDSGKVKEATEAIDKYTLALNGALEAERHPKDGGEDPAHNPVVQAAKQALDAWTKLTDTLDQKAELAGLTGLEKELQNLENQAKASEEQVNKTWNALSKDQKATATAQGNGLQDNLDEIGATKMEERKLAIDKAQESLQKLIDTANEKTTMDGLTGLEKTLEANADAADKLKDKIRAAYNALTPEERAKVVDVVYAAVGTGGTVDQGTQAKDDAAVTAQHQKELKQREADEKQYTSTVDALVAGSTDNQIEKNNAVTQKAEDSMSERVKKIEELLDKEEQASILATIKEGDDVLTMMVRIAAIVGEYNAKRKTLDDDLAAYKAKQDADTAMKNALITDVLYGQWDDYYNRLIQKAKEAGDGINVTFAQLQSTLSKVASDMTANAQTGADGWNAGLMKIRTTIQSFGQDVEKGMSAVWSSLTSSFDTAFYDVLTNKFSDLGNVLKNLWDSILKDFAKMCEQMLMRWLTTGDAMGNGQGTGGILGGLLGGSSSSGNAASAASSSGKPTGAPGNPLYVTVTNQPGQANAVQTPGGTATGSPMGPDNGIYGPNEANQPAGFTTSPGQPYPGEAGTGGGGSGITAGTIGSYGAIAGGLYAGIAPIFQSNQSYQPTYGGQNLPFSGDFGGPGGGAALSAAVGVAGVALAATAVAAAAAATAAAAVGTAAAASTAAAAATAAVVPVVGWIAAAVLVVVAALMYIFSGPAEEKIDISIKDAMSKSGATTVIGGIVTSIIGATTDFVGSLAARAGDNVSQYTQAYQKAFSDAYGSATFRIHAGSSADFQKDVDNFFKTTLPQLAMSAAFGQVGYMGGGNSNTGIAGVDWNTGNPATMDKDGNWVKKQLYDPNAPIPAMLTGLGFTADAITAIATKLADGEDIATFEKYLQGLVGVVADFKDLSDQFGQTWAQWQTTLNTAASQKGTAAEFTKSITNLTNQGASLDTMTSEDAVTAGQSLVSQSQTLLQNMATALATIQAMQTTISQTTADTVKSYSDKLKTSAQIEEDSRTAYTTDIAAISKAANPTEVQAAWKQVMTDLSTTLDAIVARINAIKSLQQSYADFRTTMATNAGPQFGTDPNAWLADNQSQIDAVTKSLKDALPGEDTVKDAQTLLTLTEARYNNEVAQLAKINGMIQSISDTGKTTSDNLKMQAMGSVVTDPTTGKQTWVADTHAQGEYLKGQYDDLSKQLAGATTPEQVQAIYTKMQGIISQLAAQPQDPANYAASRAILSKMNDDATNTATALLSKWGKTLDTDLAGTGDKLAAGETALATALDAAQKDFTTTLGLMSDAATQANNALSNMAIDITTAMQTVAAVIEHWTFVMTNAQGAVDPNWDYTKNAPKDSGSAPPAEKDVWVDDPDDDTMQICISGPDKGKHQKKPGSAPGGGGPRTPTVATVPAGTAAVVATAGSAPDGTPITATTTPGTAAAAPGSAADLQKKMADLAQQLSGDGSAGALKKQMDDLSKKIADTPPSVSVTVNSGSPEDIAQAAADVVYAQTLDALKKNNLDLVRFLKNNGALPSWSPSVAAK